MTAANLCREAVVIITENIINKFYDKKNYTRNLQGTGCTVNKYIKCPLQLRTF